MPNYLVFGGGKSDLNYMVGFMAEIGEKVRKGRWKLRQRTSCSAQDGVIRMRSGVFERGSDILRFKIRKISQYSVP